MKGILILVLVFLLIPFSGDVYAMSSSGGTVINATVTGIWRLDLSLRYPEILIPEDHYFYGNLTLFQSNSKNISVYLNKTDANGFVKFVNGSNYQDNHTLYMIINTYKNATLRVYVASGMGYEGGNYTIPIYAYSLQDQRSNSTALKVHVNNTNPVDDIKITSIYPTSIYQGESITSGISIHKIFPTEATDIRICYCINPNPTYQCSSSFNNYGCEWRTITEWLNYSKTVVVGEGPGNYYFFAAAEYPGDVNVKRAISPAFLVKKVPGPPTGPGGVAPIGAPQPELTVIAPDYLEAAPGETISLNVGVKNTGTADALNTSLNVYGIPAYWFYVTPSVQNIGKLETKNYSVSITLPRDAREQVYSLSLVGKSGTEEAVKVVTFTVAMTLQKQAQFLMEEAVSRGKEAEGIIENAKNFRMDVTVQENALTAAGLILGDARGLFGSGDYDGAAEKAKEAIDAYKSITGSVKGIIEEKFLSLLDLMRADLKEAEKLTEEKDVIDSIKEKMDESEVLQSEGRMVGAYQTLMEAKRLLDQLKGKMFFMELTQNTVIIAILVIIIASAVMVVFYKKKMSRFIKSIRIEEHKKSLKSLFKKEIRPGVTGKGRPRIDRENMEELRRLLGIGEALVDTDVKGAKEAYDKAKDIYGSLSSDEKRMVSEEIIRLARLRNNLIKRSR
jgi:hypothetical protein